MKPATKSAVRIGTAITAVVALLPYLSDFFITAYVIGALTAVWFVLRILHRPLTFKEGAQLGFLSGFYGILAASSIYDIVWHVFHYELWRIKNADRMIALFSELLHDALNPSVWLRVTLQIIIAAICAGAIGPPVGILAVRLFQARQPESE